VACVHVRPTCTPCKLYLMICKCAHAMVPFTVNLEENRLSTGSYIYAGKSSKEDIY
jgi:hypothetical protein